MAAGGGGGGGFGFGFEFDQEGNLPGGSFSSLLLSDDVVSPPLFPASPPPPHPPLFSFDTPKMLCFGDFSEGGEMGGSQITSQSLSSSSPVSKSSSNASINSLPKTSNCNKRRNGSPSPKKEAAGDISGAGAPVPIEQSGSKKCRPVATANGSRSGAGGHAKAKKREKLGDRIATLQQLVSPYGKTDTASVLHETMGYIRFLQDQVKVLCTPYLHRLPPSLPSPSHGVKYERRNLTQGLKSKGLCLVPVDGIVEMTNCNGADLWSQVTSKGVKIPTASSKSG